MSRTPLKKLNAVSFRVEFSDLVVKCLSTQTESYRQYFEILWKASK